MQTRFDNITEQLKQRVRDNGDSVVDLSDAIPEEILKRLDPKSVKSMEHGNRVAFLPNDDEYDTEEEKMVALGIDPKVADDDPLGHLVQQMENRYPLLPRLCLYGKTIQIVGGHPSAYQYLRLDGIDQVWAINPRPEWPVDQPPDVIVSRDWHYLRGPEEGDGGKAPSYGVECLKRWPDVPLIVTADIADWFYQRQVLKKHPFPEHLEGREIFELALQNLFDTEFGDLAGFSIGAALAMGRHCGANIVLTGVVCHRSEEEWALTAKRNVKTREKQEYEDKHIAAEVREWLNKYAGKCVWTHGPTVPGSVAPVWTGVGSFVKRSS